MIYVSAQRSNCVYLELPFKISNFQVFLLILFIVDSINSTDILRTIGSCSLVCKAENKQEGKQKKKRNGKQKQEREREREKKKKEIQQPTSN